MSIPFSILQLDKLAGERPFVPASVVAQLTTWAEGTIRNRATSSERPLPFPSKKIGGKRVYEVEGLRNFLLALDQLPAITEVEPSLATSPTSEPNKRGQRLLADTLRDNFEKGIRKRQESGVVS